MTEAVKVAAPRRFPAFRGGLAFSAAKAFLKRVRRRCTRPGTPNDQRLSEGLRFREQGGTRSPGRCRRSVRGVCQCALGPAAAHGPVRLVAAVFAGRMALLHEPGRSRV